jgi:hypothetical protein
MSTTAPKKKPAKKTTLSDRQYVEQTPYEDDIALKEEARYLPIDVIERDLDRWAWGTQNFTWQFYRDKRNDTWISASLELLIPWKDGKGVISERKLVGSCNFIISSYAPNWHFVATAKSECVKNAASDLGKKFGRGLNEGLSFATNNPALPETPKGKMKPDAGILAQLKKAIEEGDETHKGILLSIYEFIPEENGDIPDQ